MSSYLMNIQKTKARERKILIESVREMDPNMSELSNNVRC